MKFGNPYVTGQSVGSTDYFVGRQDILKEVKAVLKYKKAIVLSGQRRIGKTSVLDELAVRLPEEGPYVPVSISLNEHTHSSLEDVLQELASRIRDAVSPSSNEPNLDADPNHFFKVLLPELLKKLSPEKSLVLLLDEFEIWAIADGEATKAKQASVIFFPYLSDLLHSHYNLKFVFTFGCSFAQLNQDALRTFREITDVKQISLLEKGETKEIICFSEKNNTLKWSKEAIEKIWDQTQGHPLLTQALCEKIWIKFCSNKNSSKRISTATITDVNDTLDESLKNRNYFPALYWIWDGIPATEQLIASALANEGSKPITQTQLEDILKQEEVPIESNRAISLLQDWDLIKFVEEKGGYCFRVELLRRWIVKYQPLEQVRSQYQHTKGEAGTYYKKGKELYEQGVLDRALEALNSSISLNPHMVASRRLVAQVLLKRSQPNDIEMARNILKNLYDYDPYGSTRSLYVDALLKSAKLASTEEEQLKLYEHVLEIEPENPEALSQKQTISNSIMVQYAFWLAERIQNDEERLMLYEYVLQLEPNHKAAKTQRETIIQRLDKPVEKNTSLESQKESLNTVLEKQLTLINRHFDEKLNSLENSLNQTNVRVDKTAKVEESKKKTLWSFLSSELIILIFIGMLVIVGVVFQALTLEELEKVKQGSITTLPSEQEAVVKKLTAQLQEQEEVVKQLTIEHQKQKDNNDALRKDNEDLRNKVKILELRIIKLSKNPSKPDYERFLSTLESGDRIVIIGAYDRKEVAQEKVEEIKEGYSKLFDLQSGTRLHNLFGEDGIICWKNRWHVYIGGYYSLRSSINLAAKAREWGFSDDAYDHREPREELCSLPHGIDNGGIISKCPDEYRVKTDDSYGIIAQTCYENHGCWTSIAENNMTFKPENLRAGETVLKVPKEIKKCVYLDTEKFYKLTDIAKEECGDHLYWRELYEKNKRTIDRRQAFEKEDLRRLPPECQN